MAIKYNYNIDKITAGSFEVEGGNSSQFLKADGSLDSNSYISTEINDLTASVTWANVPDANITESSVTQHEAALSITEAQISDLQTYYLASNPAGYITTYTVTEADVTQYQTSLSITESQISDYSATTLDAFTVVTNSPSGSGSLVYDDAGTFTFTPANFVASINDLTDVDTLTTPPTDGQALVWSNSDSEWQPGDVISDGPQVFIQSTEPTNWSVGDFWIKT